MTQQKTLSDIAELLRSSRRVLALTHVSPDGDAIGSLLAFAWLLSDVPQPTSSDGESGGRRVVLACADPVPAELRFLPGSEQVITEVPSENWDAVVVLDASDPQRTGRLWEAAATGGAPIVNIDHHATNLRFGRHNLVAPECAATSQLLIQVADALGAPIDGPAAECMLAGIVTDTMSFRTRNVDAEVLQAAARLIGAGADLPAITERAFDSRTVASMLLWSVALSQLQHRGCAIWTSVTQEMRSAVGANSNDESGLASFLLQAPSARVSAVFSEKSTSEVEISFRSRLGFDVGQLALSLGGGGHPQAAGCTISAPLPEARERVLQLLFSACDPTSDAAPFVG